MRKTVILIFTLLIAAAPPAFAFHHVRHVDNSAVYAATLEKANKGDAMAQYITGMRYEHGDDIAQSFKTANDWFLKAAQQNNAMAELMLGDHYRYGRGVKINLPEAVKWYRKAADANIYPAQHALGRLYLTGDGVRQDFVEGYFWLSLAALDRQYAVDRDRAANLLKPGQAAAVKARAAKWWKDRGITVPAQSGR